MMLQRRDLLKGFWSLPRYEIYRLLIQRTYHHSRISTLEQRPENTPRHSPLVGTFKNHLSLKPRIPTQRINRLAQDFVDGRLNLEDWRDDFREGLWPKLMAKILYNYPSEALNFLETTAGKLIEIQCLPERAIPYTIYYIIKHYFQESDTDQNDELDKIAIRICCFILKIPSSYVLPLSGYISFHLISRLPKLNLKEFYFYLSEQHEKISIWTLMQITSRLAKFGDVALAFDALRKLTETSCHLNRPNMLSIYTTLLHESHKYPDPKCDISIIYGHIVTSGVEPNTFLYNVLIHYNSRDQKPQNSWDIYEMMIERGVEPDLVTYSILLNDSKRRMDIGAIKNVIDKIEKYGTTSKYIVTDIIHSIFLLHQNELLRNNKPAFRYKKQPPHAFDNMLQVYVKHFKLEPLMKILPGLSNVYSPTENIPSESLWDPPSATLCVMITGFLHLLDSHAAKIFYENFRNLVRAGDPAVESLVKTTYVYNVILMCFYKFEDRAQDAPEVVSDMVSPDREIPHNQTESIVSSNQETSHQVSDTATANTSIVNCQDPSRSSETISQGSSSHSPAKPDIYTWSILIKIFMRFRHSRAAEKVLSMMIRRGIKPEIITWTSIIAGYSRMQDASMTADAIHRLEEAGFTPDERIYRAMSKIHQQKNLIRGLEGRKSKINKTTVKPEWIDNLKEELAVDIAEKISD